MKPQAILGSAIVTLGVATGSLLAPQAASATGVDFTFSFVDDDNKSVSGIIRGLVEGVTTNPSQIEVTSSPFPNTTGLYTLENGSGFKLMGGTITEYDWIGGFHGPREGLDNCPARKRSQARDMSLTPRPL
jgi:hypothetical protein